MMDEFIHGPKPYLLLSATCDETLSWVIEIGLENDWVSDNNCNTGILVSPKKFTSNDKLCWVNVWCLWHYTAVYDQDWARQFELVTLNIIFSLVD
jgi:hypothetical protein